MIKCGASSIDRGEKYVIYTAPAPHKKERPEKAVKRH
jgi:hypothetical protein